MSSKDSLQGAGMPLAGCRVIEHSRTVAAAYAGRLLAAVGATVVMVEPLEGSREHDAILHALLDGDVSAAMLALRKHIESGWSLLKKSG
ncbi:MAG: Acyl-CoA transferase [Gammaproteobacteria bacterium]|jgi:crotonobetainyl-CoA:carnitine CoA-transferase CaiB-like acyl-CoA transferase|nr:Acyl-CoA transferase [Gammaproteobacteria bacterium]